MSLPNDAFHHIRMSLGAAKAANIPLQRAEYAAHKALVDQYALDMFAHLVALDARTRPNLQLMQQQTEITLRMRPVLLNHIMDLISKLNLSKATFPLAVNIIDRYCLVRVVRQKHYQLLGTTALWIASKNLDLKPKIPSLDDMVRFCGLYFEKRLFLEMERNVLETLQWLLDVPTFDAFIDFYIHAVAASPLLAGSNDPATLPAALNNLKVLAIYVCELVQFYPTIYFPYTSATVAFVAVAVACLHLRYCNEQSVHSIADAIAEATACEVPAEFDHIFAMVVKLLKLPPPVLKDMYFTTELRHFNLMQRMVVSIAQYHDKTKANFGRMQQQPGLILHTRPAVLDFAMAACTKLRLRKSIFPQAVSILDRFCTVRVVANPHVELLALTAVWVAAKYAVLDVRVPLLAELALCSAHDYAELQFMHWHAQMLELLCWSFDVRTYDAYVHKFVENIALRQMLGPQHVADLKVVASYICELSLFFPGLHFSMPPHKIAMVGALLAYVVLDFMHVSAADAHVQSLSAAPGLRALAAGEFDRVYLSFMRVLKSPPLSLKRTYFHQDLPHLPLMRQLVAATRRHLSRSRGVESITPPNSAGVMAPLANTPTMTPALSIVPLHGRLRTPTFSPATPSLHSMSPRNSELLPPVAVKRAALFPCHQLFPLPGRLPDEPTFAKRAAEQEQAVKRVRSEGARAEKAKFYIHSA